MMVKVLQINIGERRCAHDLMMAMAANIGADVIVVVEQKIWAKNLMAGFSMRVAELRWRFITNYR